jgi:TIR domain
MICFLSLDGDLSGDLPMSTAGDSIALYVAWDAGDPADAAWARDLIRELETLLPRIVGNRLSSEDQPRIVQVEGFESLPAPEAFGALSVLLLVVPSRERGFSPAAADRLRALAAEAAGARAWEGRILPLGREHGRLPAPPPLEKLQGLTLADLSEGQVTTVATAALINASLRLSRDSQASLFISYAHRDGLALAEVLSERLQGRGFKVFRDENRDRDEMIAIPPGSETQRVIQQKILEHGFLLLLDTPGAEASAWVREEVSTAFGYLLPLLPVVVEDPSGVVPPGGRFRAVRELGREVRLTSEVQGSARTPALEAAVEKALPEIEAQVVEILLEHLRSRRRLIYDSRERFEALRYSWKEHSRDHLQFEVERPTVRRNLKRMVVQCSPYSRLLRQVVDILELALREKPSFFNWAVLVHNAVASRDDEDEALAGRNFLLLRPYEIAEEAFS